jgi:hypothetical protein
VKEVKVLKMPSPLSVSMEGLALHKRNRSTQPTLTNSVRQAVEREEDNSEETQLYIETGTYYNK